MSHFLIGLVITFALLLLFSRWKLWCGVFVGVVAFGLINLGFEQTVSAFLHTFSNIDNWFLIVGVGLIPVLGGIIGSSTHMNVVLDKLKKKKKLYLMTAPAMFGLIPIPGGALMSCPLLEGFDENISNSKYVAINIWFRHILSIIYPLSSSLIIGARLTGLTIVQASTYMLPFMITNLLLGYFILLSDVKTTKSKDTSNNAAKYGRELLYLGIVLLTAPVLHVVLSTTILSNSEELSFFIAMLTSVTISTIINKVNIKKLLNIIGKSRAEQFSLLYLFILVFITAIKSFDKLDLLFAGMSPPTILVGSVALLLSFISGRIEIAISIAYPLIIAALGTQQLSWVPFTYLYFSLFTGYILSPLHPCLAFSLDYFGAKYFDVFKQLFPLLLKPLIAITLIALFV